jgi:excisionase family DNA binding protein
MEAILERPTLEIIEGEERGRAEAERIGAILLQAQTKTLTLLTGPDQRPLELPAAVCRALLAAVEILSRGDAIAIGAVHHKLTTTEAADLLGVSRQYLIRLIDRGDLPHELVGRHRRLRLGDVLAYKSRRAIERQKALSELTRLAAALGAYD